MWIWPYILNEQGTYELEKVYELTKEEIPVKVLKGCKINLINYLEENKEWLLKGAKEPKEITKENSSINT